MSLIDNFEESFVLGVPFIDRTHREFVEMLEQLAVSGDAEFSNLFPDLVSHTNAHFATEEVAMEESDFPGREEHTAEHARMKKELEGFLGRLIHGDLQRVRFYVKKQLPQWFEEHFREMDSAMGTFIKDSATARLESAPAPDSRVAASVKRAVSC